MKWSDVKYLCTQIDALDTRALCKILRIPCSHHMLNVKVKTMSAYPLPLCMMVIDRSLGFFFDHIARSSSNEDHHCAVAATIQKPSSD